MAVHYKSGEWYSYRQDRISTEQRRQMERHLAKCDQCLRTYLAAIDEAETAAAERLLHEDFNTRVMQRTQTMKRQTQKTQRRRILLQYAAAASITLALTTGGFFDAAARNIPAMMQEIIAATRAINQTAEIKWSDELVKTASTGLYKILFAKEE